MMSAQNGLAAVREAVVCSVEGAVFRVGVAEFGVTEDRRDRELGTDVGRSASWSSSLAGVEMAEVKAEAVLSAAKARWGRLKGAAKLTGALADKAKNVTRHDRIASRRVTTLLDMDRMEQASIELKRRKSTQRRLSVLGKTGVHLQGKSLYLFEFIR